MKKRNRGLHYLLEDIVLVLTLVGSVAYSLANTDLSRRENFKEPEPQIIENVVDEREPEVLITSIPMNQRNQYLNHGLKKVPLPDYVAKDYLKALIQKESSWIPKSQSPVGAGGLMQIMEDTWNEHEKEIPYQVGVFIPEKNIEVGLKYMKWQVDYCEQQHPYWDDLSTQEKLNILTAGYNTGLPRLNKRGWDISKTSSETQNHVEKINEKLSGGG